MRLSTLRKKKHASAIKNSPPSNRFVPIHLCAIHFSPFSYLCAPDPLRSRPAHSIPHTPSRTLHPSHPSLTSISHIHLSHPSLTSIPRISTALVTRVSCMSALRTSNQWTPQVAICIIHPSFIHHASIICHTSVNEPLRNHLSPANLKSHCAIRIYRYATLRSVGSYASLRKERHCPPLADISTFREAAHIEQLINMNHPYLSFIRIYHSSLAFIIHHSYASLRKVLMSASGGQLTIFREAAHFEQPINHQYLSIISIYHSSVSIVLVCLYYIATSLRSVGSHLFLMRHCTIHIYRYATLRSVGSHLFLMRHCTIHIFVGIWSKTVTTLHYAPLRSTTLHYAPLRSTTLHYAPLRFTTLHYASLRFTTLHYASLRFTTLHYASLRFTTLHYASLRFTTLHYASI